MADFVHFWTHEIFRHVPIITWIGVCLAAIFAVVYLGKRWRECMLLSCVCMAYAATPYLPHL